MGTQRVEWIGAASPQADDRVVYRKLMRLYTPVEQAALDKASKQIEPLLRTDGKSRRRLSARDGFSRDYLFGHLPGTYVQEMDDEDVQHLFGGNYPDAPEFKNLDDESHADRVPIVPWAYINKIVYGILRQAATGPIIAVKSIGAFAKPKDLVSEYERRFDVERGDHLRQKAAAERK